MATDLISQGNAAFQQENYGEAVELFTKAIEIEPENEAALAKRAHGQLNLGKNQEGLDDARAALRINRENTEALMAKGQALVYMGLLDDSFDVFLKGKKLEPENKEFELWVKKCQSGGCSNPAIPKDEGKETPAPAPTPAAAPVPTPAPAKPEPPKQEKPAAPEPAPVPPKPKIKYDWYQTDTYVTISIMIKKVKKEDAVIDIKEKTVDATIKLPSGDEDFKLHLDLAFPINVERSQAKVLGTKIDIKLQKCDGVRWQALEMDPELLKAAKLKQISVDTAAAAAAGAMKYPSSSQHTRDWDKVVTDIKNEEKEEKPEGDAALNQLFQQIYSDGNDEVRKAMNKSFSESGGTVLSTNWGEIGEKKVDVKPPDGMEFKQY